MIGIVVAGLAGFVMGGTSVLLGRRLPWRRMRRDCDADVLLPLNDPDRERVAHDFAVHVSAVDRKVTEFADTLAGEDTALRNRLRRFERGGDPQ